VTALAVAAGGLLLWRPGRPEPPAPYLVPLTSTPGSENFPTFSPDGDQIAFAWNGEKRDNTDVYVQMIGSSEARRLTTDQAVDTFPRWSPDGRQIAFVRHSDGSTVGTIRVISPLGGADRKVSDQPVVGPLSWSPDSRWLAIGAPLNYTLMRSDLPRGIRLVGVSSGETRSVTAPTESTYHSLPSLSPDGRRLAYASCSRGYMNCRLEVSQLGPDSISKEGTARRVTRGVVWPHGLAWTRDGSSLVYADQLSGDLAGRADGSNPTPLTDGPGLWQGSPRWSPDGRRIAFDSYGEDGQWDIWTIDADGGSLRRLTSSPAAHSAPTWSLDGRFVYFSSDRAGTETIWRVPVAGGPEEQMTHTGGGRCEEAADGKTLYFQRATFGDSPLLAVSLAGGQERAVIDCVPRFGFAVGPAGIYHLGCGGVMPRTVPLLLRETPSGRDLFLGTLERPFQGLAVSTDRKTILFARVVGEGSDLMLIENFR
jgi:Tol biopolymer transport system component